jgi:hypothetical protein
LYGAIGLLGTYGVGAAGKLPGCEGGGKELVTAASVMILPSPCLEVTVAEVEAEPPALLESEADSAAAFCSLDTTVVHFGSCLVAA